MATDDVAGAPLRVRPGIDSMDGRSPEGRRPEAYASSRLDRAPLNLKVFAAGIDGATQTPWLAMEFLEGESLAAFAKARGVLAPEVVPAELQQVGHALSAAQAAGLVHCDLKPENIIIAESQTMPPLTLSAPTDCT